MALFSEKDIAEKESRKTKGKGTTSHINTKKTFFSEKEMEKHDARKGLNVIKTPEKNFKNAKKKEKRPEAKKSIAEILPIVDMTNAGIFELKEKQGFFDIWQLESKDIYSMNDQETRFDIYNLAHFYQAYQHPIKIVSLNFPVSTEKQQLFIQKKIEECDNELYEKFLMQKLKELQFLEWGRTNREYFLFVFGPTEFVVRERVDSANRYLSRAVPLSPVSEEKKIDILFKLYNQNSKLGTKNKG